MANHFASEDIDVTIVSVSVPKSGDIFGIDNRVKIDYLRVDLNQGNKIYQKILSVFAVKNYFNKVISNTFLLGMGNYAAILVALLPQKSQIKKIGCQHGSYASVRHIWYLLRWLLFRRLDTVVSLTNYDVPNLRKLNKNICVIPNCISFYPEHCADLDKKKILAVGRIDYPKGYDLLIEVFSQFAQRNKDWKLQIIGDGPQKPDIKKLIQDKGLTDRVAIVPFTNSILEEYLSASVYLMTSRTEGLPMVLLEAQACGLPLISFNCETGPSDIITNNVDGYLIDNFDTACMSEKLYDLCSDLAKRNEFGQNGRKNVLRFSPEQVYVRWASLFGELET